jgi:hypothetical protein
MNRNCLSAGARFLWQRYGAVLLLLLLAIAGPTWSQQPQSSADLGARIDRLIQQLDDDKFEAREKAEAELASIGEAALARLNAVLKDPAP